MKSGSSSTIQQTVTPVELPTHYYNQLLDALPMAAYICDPEGHIIHYNRLACILAGKEPLKTDRWSFMWKTADTEGNPFMAKSLMDMTSKDGNTTLRQPLVVERPDGSQRSVTMCAQPLSHPDGESMGMLIFLQDLSAAEEAERTMKENEKFFHDLLKALPVAIYICDKAGYVTFFNDYAVQLWGRTPEIGKDLWCGSWKIFLAGDTPITLDECPMAVTLKEQREVTGEEIIIQRPDGSKRNVIPYPKPIFNKNGNLAGAVNMLVDITEIKINEEKGGHLAAIVQSSADAIISKTLDGIVRSWNASAERIFGFTSEEMVGQSITKIIPAERLMEESEIISKLKKGEQVEHFETRRINKNKQSLDVSLTISPVRNSRGEIIGASKIARDITSQNEAFKALREREDFLRMAVEFTGLGTFDYQIEVKYLTWSRECRRIYQVSAEANTDFETLLSYIHPMDSAHARTVILNTLKPGGNSSYDVSFRIIRQVDGDVRWVRTQGKAYFTAAGVPERLIGTVLDISDERNTQDMLEKAVKERTIQLIEINEQLEKFAYAASHDLQEPLRKIQTFSDLLNEHISDTELSIKYSGKIGSSARRMSDLIKNVLNYSRLSLTQYDFAPVDLNGILEDARNDLELVIAEKNASIHASKLPVVRGIQPQLYQLFTNLISNSLKFCEDRPQIRISSRILEATEIYHFPDLTTGLRYVQLVFQDNGIGFEKKYSEQIFVIFQRLHNNQVYSGTGIGLTMCKKIVENHHGIISVESEPGKGSCFTVVLAL